jgi:hypothetical protein
MTQDQFAEIVGHIRTMEIGGGVAVVSICAMLLWLGFCVLRKGK